MKEKKSLFGIDESALIKLKGIKVIPKDSGKSNIMKILFPRKQFMETVSPDLNKSENKTDDLVLSRIRNENDTDSNSEKEFIEVDNILLVRDPKDIDDQINNMLNEDDASTTNNRPIYLEPIEKIDTTNLTLAERLKNASKRRMMDKMAKLELSLQRELFKREDTQSKKEKNAEKSGDKVEGDTVLSASEAPKVENNESESEKDAPIAQEETKNDVQATSTEAGVPKEIQSTEEPKQKELISATLSIVNEEENRNIEEPNLGAVLSSSSDNVQENVNENVTPSEDKTDQLSLAHIETESANEENGGETALGSSLPAVNTETIAEAAETNEPDVIQTVRSDQTETKNSENKGEIIL